MTRWSKSCRSVLPHFLLLLGSTLPLSSSSPTAAVGAHLRPREPIPQEWVPPQTVTVTETAHYTLTVMTTLTIDPGISTSMVISEITSTTKSTTTQTSTLTSTTSKTIKPKHTAAPNIRRQAPQQPSTVTVTTTVWGPDVTITSAVSITAPATYVTTMTSMSTNMATDIITESTTTTSIATATATAGVVSEAGRDARPGSKNKKPVAIIVGATFASFIIVIALLVLLYLKLAKGKEARGIAIGETAAAGAAGAKKRHAMSAIKSLLRPGRQPYNPVPASDTNLINPPYNPANTSFSHRSFPPPPEPYPHPHQDHHSYFSYSTPPAPTFPPTASASTYLPVSPVAPRLPQIQVTRANTTSTVSSLSSSGHSDQPVPIHPLTTAGARLPSVREAQFHALTTAGEERMMSPPPQEGPVEPEPLRYSPRGGGSSGGGGGGGGGASDWRRPFS